MKTNKYLVVSLLAVMALSSCSNDENYIDEPKTAENLDLSAGISTSTRAVIDANYGSNLNVAFVRVDNPTSPGNNWMSSVNAVRAGGNGNTAITFDNTETYAAMNVASYLLGFYPRPATPTTAGNPVNVGYTITGDEDIMATAIQSGSTNAHFQPFTFNHLLTQLQFQCVGSSDALELWTGITSITVQDVPNTLTLAIDKDRVNLVPELSLVSGAPDTNLPIFNCPDTLAAASSDKQTGYIMLYPTVGLGGADDTPITLEVTGMYRATTSVAAQQVTRTVTIDNIAGGVRASQSHLLTLTFTVDGEINITAGIAEWLPGNGGGTTVTPRD